MFSPAEWGEMNSIHLIFQPRKLNEGTRICRERSCGLEPSVPSGSQGFIAFRVTEHIYKFLVMSVLYCSPVVTCQHIVEFCLKKEEKKQKSQTNYFVAERPGLSHETITGLKHNKLAQRNGYPIRSSQETRPKTSNFRTKRQNLPLTAITSRDPLPNLSRSSRRPLHPSQTRAIPIDPGNGVDEWSVALGLFKLPNNRKTKRS